MGGSVGEEGKGMQVPALFGRHSVGRRCVMAWEDKEAILNFMLPMERAVDCERDEESCRECHEPVRLDSYAMEREVVT